MKLRKKIAVRKNTGATCRPNDAPDAAIGAAISALALLFTIVFEVSSRCIVVNRDNVYNGLAEEANAKHRQIQEETMFG